MPLLKIAIRPAPVLQHIVGFPRNIRSTIVAYGGSTRRTATPTGRFELSMLS